MNFIQNQSLKIILICSLHLAIPHTTLSKEFPRSNLSSNLSSQISAYFGKNSQNLHQKIELEAFKSQDILNFDGSKIIDYFNELSKNSARIMINSRNMITSITLFHEDSTQTRISYHPDKTQTIETFDIDHKNSSRTEINVYGKPIWSVKF